MKKTIDSLRRLKKEIKNKIIKMVVNQNGMNWFVFGIS